MTRPRNGKVLGSAMSIVAGASLILGGCSSPETDASRSASPSVAEEAAQKCEKLPAVKRISWDGTLAVLKFAKKSSCEVPIWPTPGETYLKSLKVGEITAQSTFTLDCKGNDTMAATFTAHVLQEKKPGQTLAHGYIEVAVDSSPPASVGEVLSHLPVCPPDNSDLM